MSENQYTRQAAKRVLPTDLNAASSLVSLEDRDQAPKFLVLPSGAGANRVLMAGVATNIVDVGDGNPYLRMEATDVAGNTFYAYAGEYQKEPRAVMSDLEPPARVLVIGKPRTLERDDGGVMVSIRPEDVKVISEEQYLDILTEAATHTIQRLTGERGAEHFQEEARETYDQAAEHEKIFEAAMETLKAVHEDASEGDAGEGGFSRDELQSMDYNELSSLAGEFDDVSGNAPAAEIIDALEGRPAPA